MKKRREGGGIPPEEFETAFGDGFWDLPVDQRAEMLIKKMLGQNVEKVSKNDARRHQKGEGIRS
jgi:hypothetical protein